MRPPQPHPDTDDAGIAAVDAAMEELRHASYGYFGPAARASLQLTIRWAWSPAHYRLLRMVEASRLVAPTVNDLAGALVTDAARASRIVTELQRSGLVNRRIAVNDRRRREVVLTGAGQHLLDEARRARMEHLSTVLQDWDASDAADLARLLDRFNESVRHVAPYWTSSTHRSSATDEP